MRRGLISWSREEVPASVLDERRERLAAAMRAERMDALIAYTSFPRPAAVSWLTHFVPYWGEGVLVVTPEGPPSLLAAYSKRGETWIREVSHVDEVIMTPNLGQGAIEVLKKRVPSAAGKAARIGIVERDEFPWTIAEPMVEQGLAEALLDASALFASVRQPADDAEIGLARHAQRMAEGALDAVPPDARRASAALSAIEANARRAGAEEVLLRIVPDLAAATVMQRIEGEAVLGDRFAVQVSLAYKGVWVRATRNFSSASQPPSWKAAQRWFAEAAAGLDVAAGPAKPPEGKLAEWSVECCLGTRPLSIVARGNDAEPQQLASRSLPKGALAVMSARLALDGGAWFASAPVVIGANT